MRYEEAKLISRGSVDEQDGGMIRRITFLYYIGWDDFPLAILPKRVETAARRRSANQVVLMPRPWRILGRLRMRLFRRVIQKCIPNNHVFRVQLCDILVSQSNVSQDLFIVLTQESRPQLGMI